ncbi:MAG: hypothetical protein AB1345_04500 [Chloroflexota bacterium]
MKRLRFSVLLLLILTAILFNIERIDIGAERDIINIQSFVYVIAGVSVLLMIAFPIILRLSVFLQLAFWLVLYLVVKLFVFTSRPLIGGVYTYLSIAEMALISLSVAIAYVVARQFTDAEDTIANITLDGVSNRVLRLDSAKDEVSREFIRSRRYQRPLSILLLQLDDEAVNISVHNTAKEIMRDLMRRYTMTSLLRSIDAQLRRSDLVLEEPKKNRLILVLPETDATGSSMLANRIKEAISDHLGISISCGLASFPDQALTFEELIHRAEASYLKPPIEALGPVEEEEEVEKVAKPEAE